MNSSISSSDRPGARHERRFVLGTMTFVLAASLLFCAASEWLVRTHVAPNQNIEPHAEFLRTATIPNAAFGDSHVAMGITGTNRVANLGFPANTLNDIIGKARLYFDRVDPGMVILQADPQQLVPGRLNRTFEPDRPLFTEDRGLMRWFKLAVPVYRRAVLGHWETFLKDKPFTQIRDFNPENGSQTATRTIEDWTDERIDAFAREILVDQWGISIDPNHPVLRAYRELAQWIIDKGGRVCFVAYPVDRVFRATATTNATEARADALFREMAASVGAPYLNYRDKAFPRSLFYDPDHLNLEGGTQFTRTVLQDCFGYSLPKPDDTQAESADSNG